LPLASRELDRSGGGFGGGFESGRSHVRAIRVQSAFLAFIQARAQIVKRGAWTASPSSPSSSSSPAASAADEIGAWSACPRNAQR
jgi:hypothetical protein